MPGSSSYVHGRVFNVTSTAVTTIIVHCNILCDSHATDHRAIATIQGHYVMLQLQGQATGQAPVKVHSVELLSCGLRGWSSTWLTHVWLERQNSRGCGNWHCVAALLPVIPLVATSLGQVAYLQSVSCVIIIVIPAIIHPDHSGLVHAHESLWMWIHACVNASTLLSNSCQMQHLRRKGDSVRPAVPKVSQSHDRGER